MAGDPATALRRMRRMAQEGEVMAARKGPGPYEMTQKQRDAERSRIIELVGASEQMATRIVNLLAQHGYNNCEEAFGYEGATGISEWRGAGEGAVRVMRAVVRTQMELDREAWS